MDDIDHEEQPATLKGLWAFLMIRPQVDCVVLDMMVLLFTRRRQICDVKPKIDMEGDNISNVAILLVLTENSYLETSKQDAVKEVVTTITGMAKEDVTLLFTNKGGEHE